jgi:hypothetical protein
VARSAAESASPVAGPYHGGWGGNAGAAASSATAGNAASPKPIASIHLHRDYIEYCIQYLYRTPGSLRLLIDALQLTLEIRGGLLDAHRHIFQHLRYLRNLGIRLRPLLRIHVLTHGGDGLCPIAGVGTRRIHLILEPWTLGKTRLIEEQTRHMQKIVVDERQ